MAKCGACLVCRHKKIVYLGAVPDCAFEDLKCSILCSLIFCNLGIFLMDVKDIITAQ